MLKSIKSKLFAASIVVSSIALPTAALAAESSIPQPAQDAITSIGETATGMIDLAWPVIALVVGGFLAIKLFKKVSNKV
ncbi:major coat protein [Providencia sp. PROV179]|uniref:major coat protein n=1 Tax=Providencia sp. PROV179 TaxID=2949882 RepID=UPI002349EF71|nr:major coat protein [Providencia sp. PROV179]